MALQGMAVVSDTASIYVPNLLQPLLRGMADHGPTETIDDGITQESAGEGES